jgi:hypothetical protein
MNRKENLMAKIEIRQVDGERGIFTEVLIDGHKIDGVRRFTLNQGVGDGIPTLTLDLNALNLATDMRMVRIMQEGLGEIESIKFKN